MKRYGFLFQIVFMEEARGFLNSIPPEAKEKMDYVIYRVAGGEKNKELFKKLENSDGIWEFRVLWKKTAYRLFAFWDTENETLVVATHGIVKKTQKTPQKEIKKAETIKKEYFNSKSK